MRRAEVSSKTYTIYDVVPWLPVAAIDGDVQVSTPHSVRFGVSTLPAQDLPGVLERVRFIEACGFDTAGFPDTQTIYPDPFVAMGAAAANDSGLRLVTSVSNPVTRHPSVTATAMSGVMQLAAGGAVYVLAAGDTSQLNIGRHPARLADVRAYLSALVALRETGRATFRGETIRFANRPARFPIHLAAHGPRSLELAGELADGVWIGAGIGAAEIGDALAHVRAGAERAGRALADLELACFVRCFIGERTAGVRTLSPSLAAVGHYALARAPEGKGIPSGLRAAFAALAERYDTISHAVGGDEAPNACLIRELGLQDYLADRFALIGSTDNVMRGLERLVDAGVRTFMMFLRGADLDAQMRHFGAEVIGRVRASRTRPS